MIARLGLMRFDIVTRLFYNTEQMFITLSIKSGGTKK